VQERSNGYRRYSPAQLPELHRILALKDLGIPLSEIATLASDPHTLETAVRMHRLRLERERRQLERRLAAAAIRLHVDRHGDPISIVTHTVASQLYARFTVWVSGIADLEPAFDHVESVVRDDEARAASPPLSIEHRARSGTRRVDLMIPITHGVDAHGIVNERLPECTVAAVLHRGSYDDLAVTNRTLSQWLRRTRTASTGPRRFVYLQFGADESLELPGPFVVGRAEQFLTEIQQPIM
ncbi:MAG: MerR family transcriptional regulator, partial [Ilumatobacteraceae bacterium]